MRIATILAHPDDAEIWAGGTLLKHSLRGDQINLMTFADPNGPRRAEAFAGANLLNAECQVEDRSRFSSLEQLTQSVDTFLRLCSPDIVITHWNYDTHYEHNLVHEAVTQVVVRTRIDTGHPRILFACDTYNSMGSNGPFYPNYYVDVTDTFDQKLNAINEHRSQPIERWVKMAKMMGTLHGSRCDCSYAEAFLQVPILGHVWACPFLPEVIQNP